MFPSFPSHKNAALPCHAHMRIHKKAAFILVLNKVLLGLFIKKMHGIIFELEPNVIADLKIALCDLSCRHDKNKAAVFGSYMNMNRRAHQLGNLNNALECGCFVFVGENNLLGTNTHRNVGCRSRQQRDWQDD